MKPGRINLARLAALLTGLFLCGTVWALIAYLVGIDNLPFVVGTMALIAFCLRWRAVEDRADPLERRERLPQ
jgi:hypothetical protein